jgi:uncharacterized membrane protein YhdT
MRAALIRAALLLLGPLAGSALYFASMLSVAASRLPESVVPGGVALICGLLAIVVGWVSAAYVAKPSNAQGVGIWFACVLIASCSGILLTLWLDVVVRNVFQDSYG